jgi:hypothetical protein
MWPTAFVLKWPTAFVLKELTAAEEAEDWRTREETGELRTE